MDERMLQLAKNLINYSCELKSGEKVLINGNGTEGLPLVKLLIKEAYNVGAVPFADIGSNDVLRELLLNASEQQLKMMEARDADFMSQMDAFIGVRSNPNDSELSDVPLEKMSMYNRFYSKKVHSEIRVRKTKWVVLRYPTNGMAQAAEQSLDGFEDFYYRVCNLDYGKMSTAMDNLVYLMDKTDKVQIKGSGTDLTFSIKGIPSVKCDGKRNIPDGEVYTAPIKDSVNGRLTYNTPSEFQGFTFDDVCFTFKDGKIISATANSTEKINEVLDTDEGARYIGEFAIGVNPYILKQMKNTLFDEKIMGSFHFTPGNAYDHADNTNRSAIHWDLVCIQTPEYGGGEIYFDGVLIRKDGLFVVPELLCLNPDQLK